MGMGGMIGGMGGMGMGGGMDMNMDGTNYMFNNSPQSWIESPFSGP